MNVLNLFNLLCVQEPKQNEILYIIMLFIPIVVAIVLLYGLLSFCENYYKRASDERGKYKFKSGIICIVISILILFVTYIFIAINKDTLYDGCGNLGPIVNIFIALTRIGYVFSLIVLIAKFLVNILYLLKYRKKDDEMKNNYKKKALLYFIIIVIVYLVLILTNVGFKFITQGSNDGNWAHCWCK